jgi:hypothetical protein
LSFLRQNEFHFVVPMTVDDLERDHDKIGLRKCIGRPVGRTGMKGRAFLSCCSLCQHGSINAWIGLRATRKVPYLLSSHIPERLKGMAHEVSGLLVNGAKLFGHASLSSLPVRILRLQSLDL